MLKLERRIAARRCSSAIYIAANIEVHMCICLDPDGYVYISTRARARAHNPACTCPRRMKPKDTRPGSRDASSQAWLEYSKYKYSYNYRYRYRCIFTNISSARKAYCG